MFFYIMIDQPESLGKSNSEGLFRFSYYFLIEVNMNNKKEIDFSDTVSPIYEGNFLYVAEMVLGRNFLKFLEQGQHKSKYLSISVLEYLQSHWIGKEDVDEYERMKVKFAKIDDEISRLRILLEFFVFGVLSFEIPNRDYFEFHFDGMNTLIKQIERSKKKINNIKNK